MAFDHQLRLQALQHALEEARQARDAARRRYAAHGMDPADTRADLERRLSAQELDQLHAEVEARLQEIERKARLAAAAPPAASPHRHPPSTV